MDYFATCKCTKCSHVQTVKSACVDSDGGMYFGSAFDFCDICDKPVEVQKVLDENGNEVKLS